MSHKNSRYGLVWKSIRLTAVAVLFGMLAAGCGSNSGSDTAGPGQGVTVPDVPKTLNGTWYGEDGIVLVVSDSSFEASAPYQDSVIKAVKGTFSTSKSTDGDSITLTPTHIHGEAVNVILAEYVAGQLAQLTQLATLVPAKLSIDSKWYTPAELKAAIRKLLGSVIYGLLGIDKMLDEQFAEVFIPRSGTYILDGNNMSITVEGETEAFTRRQ
jgi:hypothetical protein